MIDPQQIPDKVWKKVQQLTGFPEHICRQVAAAAINAWPGMKEMPFDSAFGFDLAIVLPVPQKGDS